MQKQFNKAQALSTKLDKLNSHFDIAESTIGELSEYIDTIVPEINTDIEYDERTQNLITINLLKKDFILIRDTLLTNISNGKNVISAMTVELMSLEGTQNAQMLLAYGQLVGIVNNSMKLLTSTYKDIIEIQKSVIVEEEKDNQKNGNGDVYNTQINFGSVSELIKQIKEQG